MIWMLDPVAAKVWIVASSLIGLAYCSTLSHALPRMVDADAAWAARMARFINFCGAGHVLMVLFMGFAHDNVYVWRFVVFWDVLTAIVSVEFAIRVFIQSRK